MALLLVIGIGLLFEPNCFRFAVGQAIRFESWRHGVSTQIGGIEGSLREPLTLRNSVWIYESGTGPVTRVEIDAATAEFSWRNLLPRSSGAWFERLTVDGLRGKIQFPLEAAAESPGGALMARLPWPNLHAHWLPAPERIEARNVDFVFQNERDYVRIVETEFTLSTVEPGVIRAGQLHIHQPWLSRTFRDLRGTTAIQDTKVEIANVTLDKGVLFESLSAELDDLARGRLNLKMRLAAFGGTIRVDAQTLHPARPFAVEATGFFSQIGVAKLTTFLGASDAAGGTIKEGNFKFRGPPQQIARATASLRLEATNFQWDSRQWDTLVLGATLLNGRIQMPELALLQGQNRLTLNGEMPLPEPGVQWWQSEFTMNISARIGNLTELSALMLPEFHYAAGKVNIDGSIRGKNQQFHGQLIVSGTNLKWRNAPIEELHAGVNLNGNEFQLTNISLFNNGDYLRGHGVVNIIGGKQYWGEVRASIEDLSKYAALLQKPILPEPLAGGAVIDWSGEGSAKGHSGRFAAQLRKLRSLGATAVLLHPINADLDGTYAPGMMQFSRFMLSDDDASFTANVGVGNKALSLQGIKLYHRQALWLEGDALLPLDVWNAWPNTNLSTLLDDQTASKVNLTAYNLSLREASRLTGWKFPIEGIVLGNLVADGPLSALKTSGKLSLSKARIPLGWSGAALTQVEAAGTLAGQTLTLSKFAGRHPSGDFSANGQVDYADLRNPDLQLAITSQKTDVTIFSQRGVPGTASVAAQFKVTGPWNKATVSGEAQLTLAELGTTSSAAVPDFESLLLAGLPIAAPTIAAIRDAPWNSWHLDIAARTSQPAPARWKHPGSVPPTAPAGTLSIDLKLQGTGAQPVLTGSAVLRNLPIRCGATPLQLSEAALTFREGFPLNPSITAQATGLAFGEPFAVHLTGTIQHPIRFYSFGPPLTERLIRLELSGENPAPPSQEIARFGLRVPTELFKGVDVAEWPSIPTPAPMLPAPPPGAVQ